jgi:hypothetical protein
LESILGLLRSLKIWALDIYLQKQAKTSLSAAAFQNTVFSLLGCGQRSDGDTSKKTTVSWNHFTEKAENKSRRLIAAAFQTPCFLF